MSSTGAPAPRVRIRRATPNDARAIAKVHFEAFGPGVMNRLMHPDGVSDDVRVKFAGSIFPPTEKAAEEQPSAEVIVMVAELEEDGRDPAIVAFAKWKLVRDERPQEEWEKEGEEPMTEEQLGQGANAAVYNTFINGLHQMKKRWVKGEPHIREFFVPLTRRTGGGSPDKHGRSGDSGGHAYPAPARSRISVAQMGLRAC